MLGVGVVGVAFVGGDLTLEMGVGRPEFLDDAGLVAAGRGGREALLRTAGGENPQQGRVSFGYVDLDPVALQLGRGARRGGSPR